jgi:MFS superfamily sulfate permease-like transporter
MNSPFEYSTPKRNVAEMKQNLLSSPDPNLNLKISSTEEDFKSFPMRPNRFSDSSLSIYQRAKILCLENWASGMTVGLVNLPLSISLAVAAGATPQSGVVTAIISGISSGVIGGSHYNVVGPTGALAGFLMKANIFYSAVYGVNCLPTIAIYTGLLIIVSVFLNIQKMIDFVPGSVNEGFTLGVSIILFLGQLNNLLGLSLPRREGLLEGLKDTINNFQEINLSSTLMGLSFLILLLGLVRKWPKIPWICVFTAFGITLGSCREFLFSNANLPILSDRYPNLTFDNYLSNLQYDFSIVINRRFPFDLLPIAFVSILETLISAKIADVVTNTKFNPKSEVLSLGVSNIVSGLLGGIPSTAALARTRLNILAGGTHKISALINSLTMIMVTLFLFNFFQYLPLCVIAASVIYVAIRMVDFPELRILYHAELDQFIIALLVAVFSVCFDSTYGVIAGMFTFLVLFFGKFLQPQRDIILPRNIEPEEKTKISKLNLLGSPGQPGPKHFSRNFSVNIMEDNGKLRLNNLISQETLLPLEESGDLLNQNAYNYEKERFCLYKFMGIVNFLNIEQHIKNIEDISEYKNIVLSFRYCISFDTVALHSLEKAFNSLIKKGRVIFLAFVPEQLLKKINIVCGENWVETLRNHKKLFLISE